MRTFATRFAGIDGMVRLLALFVGLAVVIAAPFAIWGEHTDRLWSTTALVESATDSLSYAWLIIVALLVADILIPVPNTAVIAAGGILYGPFLGGTVATVGLVLAGLVGYGASRRFGRPVARWLIGEDGLAEGERLFANSGGWLVAASRWLPILPEVISCMAGLARMPLHRFVLAMLCGVVPLAFAFATAGYYGADRPLLTLVLAALLPLPVWYAIRSLQPKAKP
ncbi:TVP38/TMEM64 family protein [Microbaculum sp. FT89]|uniref:TVP38/TMEM64 family protein n=1 Tax=Microbaculum sp. FT89 TaxID=3447298 RepID=UPI003F537470